MKSIIFAALFALSTGAMASTVITCPEGSDPANKAVWAKVTIAGDAAFLVSNLNQQPNNDLVEESLKLAERPNESQFKNAVFASNDQDAKNDSDFNYKVSFSKAVLDHSEPKVTLFV